MASSRNDKGKKSVSQEELRRLMKEKQKETTGKKKRIESPFAKYNSLGHLSCVLCNIPVKSEILWQTHVLGKPHKEKVAELKGTKQGQIVASVNQNPTSSVLKRKTSDSQQPTAKKGKAEGSSSASGIPADFFDGGQGQNTAGSKKPSGLGLLAGNYDDNDASGDEEQAKQNVAVLPPSTTPGLPADFFDSGLPSVPGVSHSGSILKVDEPEKPVERKENTAEALPEGFFDDPVVDAKVRKVDAPKDLMDKEWEEFQKEMRHVNSASEAIVAEEDEDGRLERQIDEIDEQIECYRRVELLRDRREVMKNMGQVDSKPQQEQRSSGDKEEEEDEEELFSLLSRDWRAKRVLN
ncbi:zinc finger protein 830-like [Paramormyrops kingsleyae]|uniref:Zinc finger protein 830 n=1 Tax=Paramormyrops kingsleyae TaxID=1676925 RepID=A0A3B3QCD7_9TELE|nr:zinc finger protein 830 isoform X1 [Paramormyrops kingsleyae]